VRILPDAEECVEIAPQAGIILGRNIVVQGRAFFRIVRHFFSLVEERR